MSQSLSVVIPAHNSQAALAQQVNQLLEFLPDLVDEFEIMIVDDASTDQTEEVALELARRYPQVRVARHARVQGQQAAIGTGIQRTNGDIVFVQDEPSAVSPAQMRRLWELRGDEQVVMAQADAETPRLATGLIHRLMDWGEKLKQSVPRSGGLRMIRRRAVQYMSQADIDNGQLATQRLDSPTNSPTREKHDAAAKMTFDFHQV